MQHYNPPISQTFEPQYPLPRNANVQDCQNTLLDRLKTTSVTHEKAAARDQALRLSSCGISGIQLALVPRNSQLHGQPNGP